MLRVLRLLAQIITLVGMTACAGLVMMSVFGTPARDPGRLRHFLATRQIESFMQALGRFKDDCGDFPDGAVGLEALSRNPGLRGWRGPYLSGEVPLDPWRRPYVYVYTPRRTSPEIISYGADGKIGGRFFDADVTSHNLSGVIDKSPLEEASQRGILFYFCAAIGGLFLGAALLMMLRRYQTVSPRNSD